MGLRLLSCWDCAFEYHRWHGCLSLVSDVCCQVEVSGSRLSLVQRSPIKCGVSECHHGSSTLRRACPNRADAPR